MQLTEHLYPLLLFLPFAAASLGVWVYLIRVRFAMPLFAPRAESLPKASPVLIVTALLLVVMQVLLPAIFVQLNPIAQNSPELAENLYKVRTGVATDFAMLAIGLMVILPLLRNDRRLIGLHLENPKSQCFSGIMGFTLSILPVALLVAAVAPFKKPEQLHGMLQLLQNDPSAELITWIIVSAVIAAPLS
ncbi:MAG TPA: hypothetical protein VLA12_10425, partial [Planctomycetaceae bacterium]|nr:hypothetical protein [Planctomycetaceae bacterium]